MNKIPNTFQEFPVHTQFVKNPTNYVQLTIPNACACLITPQMYGGHSRTIVVPTLRNINQENIMRCQKPLNYY